MAYGLPGRSLVEGRMCSMAGDCQLRLHARALIATAAALLCSVCTPAIAAGGTIKYSYDALGRLTAVQYATGVVVTYVLDAAGNRKSVTTTQPPSAPGTPVISSITGTTAAAQWTASTGTTPSGYQYSLNGGAWMPTGTALSASLSGLTSGTLYTIAVEACDAEGGCGSQSSASFTTAPSAPGAVTISNVTANTATASWGTATGGATGYEYSLNGEASWTTVGNVLTTGLTALVGGTSYTFYVRAYNAGNNFGAVSSSSFKTITVVPSTPSGLNATVAGNTQINLSWNASSDTGGPGIAGYAIYRNGAKIGTTSSTSYNDTGVAVYNTYTYTVAAYDSSGNNSLQSSSVSASTFYTITSSSGTILSTASAMYSLATGFIPGPNGAADGHYYWIVTETVGSKVTAVDVNSQTESAAPPACDDPGTATIATGYELNGNVPGSTGCVLTAEPSVYGK